MSEAIKQDTAEPGVPPLTLGWRIQMAMAYGDKSIAELAVRCGVGRSTISRWIHDTGKRPRPGDLRLLADECGVMYRWLAPKSDEEMVGQVTLR